MESRNLSRSKGSESCATATRKSTSNSRTAHSSLPWETRGIRSRESASRYSRRRSGRPRPAGARMRMGRAPSRQPCGMASIACGVRSMKMSSPNGLASSRFRTRRRGSAWANSQGSRTSRSARRSPSKSIRPSQGPPIQSSAGRPRTRVPGPGAPAAAQAPAVTESIRVQVAATLRGTIWTSCDAVRSTKQKNPARRLQERDQPAETFHVRVFPKVPEELRRLSRRGRPGGLVGEQREPAGALLGRGDEPRTEAGGLPQTDPGGLGGGNERRKLVGDQAPLGRKRTAQPQEIAAQVAGAGQEETQGGMTAGAGVARPSGAEDVQHQRDRDLRGERGLRAGAGVQQGEPVALRHARELRTGGEAGPQAHVDAVERQRERRIGKKRLQLRDGPLGRRGPGDLDGLRGIRVDLVEGLVLEGDGDGGDCELR